MEKEFVFYKEALALKELGFDEPCFRARSVKSILESSDTTKNSEWSNNYFVAQPTWSSAFDWFREKYGYWSYIKEASKGTNRFYIEKFDEKFFNSEIYNSYEESKLECLKKLIQMVKNKQFNH